MKYLRDPAPALSRGLEILRTLSGEAPLSLEELTGRLKYPKASAFRLLATLQNLGLVRRREDRRYEPLWTLRPLHAPAADRRQRLLDRLPALAAELKATVEWYEPSAAGMVLMRQEVSEGELRVQARPGFLRAWDGEADATMMLGHAFYPEAPSLPARLPAYIADGAWSSISRREVKKRIDAAAAAGVAVDAFFNENSVRRTAASVMAGEAFLGVLGVASIYRFHRTQDPAVLSRRLRGFIDEIS